MIKKKGLNNVSIYCVFASLSVLLFWPVLNKNFAADDFNVLYRVVYHHGFFMKDYFRPLSDYTLYFSYLTGGFHPFAYNVFNVLMHAACSYMLYCFGMIYRPLAVQNRAVFAWCAGLLFLIYPFHIETIAWVVGRASLVSCFFGFLSLLAAVSAMPARLRYTLSCIFYFLGLCSYETILPLPAIILLLIYDRNIPLKRQTGVAVAFICTFALNMIIRYKVSGVISGAYGSRMFEFSVKALLVKILKAFGRLFLPPSENTFLLSVGFFIAALFFCWLLYLLKNKSKEERRSGAIILLSLLFSCTVPFLFGVNTKTIESDRILYFSSFFVCLMISWLMSVLLKHNSYRLIAFSLACYSFFFFYKAILIWKEAGVITDSILSAVPAMKKESRNVYLLNFPEEYKGAQVLRNGFIEALLINDIDTSGITIISYSGTGYEPREPARLGDTAWYFYPNTVVRSGMIYAKIWPAANLQDSVRILIRPETRLYYWNKTSFHPFKITR